MMKIAIPTKENKVDDHFGHCDYYSIFEIDDQNKILSKTLLASPPQCGCKSGIILTLKEQGVKVMLAGNMGVGAIQKLSASGIDVIRGCSGDVTSVINKYLSGNLIDSGETCQQHNESHVCGH